MSLKKPKALIELLVPEPIIVALVGVLSGAFMSMGMFDITYNIVLTCIAYGFAIGAFNVLNCISDVNPDIISKPFRPLPSKKLSMMGAFLYYIIVTMVSLIVAYMINTTVFLGCFIIFIFSIMYSIYPRLKKIYLLNTIIISVCYSTLPLIVGWSLFSGMLNFPWHIALILNMMAFILVVVKDIHDIKADRAYGVTTIPVVLGIRKTGRMLKRIIIVPYLIILIMIFLGIFSYTYILSFFTLLGAFHLSKYIEKYGTEELGSMLLTEAMLIGIILELLIALAFVI